MGCTSAKQVSAVPNDEEGRGKAYSNGDLFTDEYKMKGVEEVKYMRGEEDRVNARNQENLAEELVLAQALEADRASAPEGHQEKSSTQHRTKQHKEVPGPSANKTNMHTSESQQEFFRMLDEKIEKGRGYSSEEEDDVT
ncbi:uncharacterized protein C1orf21 homolog isoform X1 [Sinocyclocheilus grahami]|uniref:uncharacterized protein C1orf21 homolog isoform X1 n=2 Tax=Sinocyclocheilus grahami TaxID=75366 RepID=UPI0007AC7E3B|nr:PREDICTED: uncharacterized protein C1orf21 homolog isoform X1 [Sinocyclocheilus grahami]